MSVNERLILFLNEIIWATINHPNFCYGGLFI